MYVRVIILFLLINFALVTGLLRGLSTSRNTFDVSHISAHRAVLDGTVPRRVLVIMSPLLILA